MNSIPVSPAEQLAGMELKNGWRVGRALTLPGDHTGGYFSCGYMAHNGDGRDGYLKALDFFGPLYHADDPAEELLSLTESFVYERNLLELCSGARLSRVVRSLDSGTVRFTRDGSVLAVPVPYLIFELAEGDVRTHLNLLDKAGLAWALRSLHHVANGLRQLHEIGVAHQDLKPSNVLLFDGASSSKIADLGRSTRADIGSPHEDATIAGALAYAPPELLYREPPEDWLTRRCGCDAYLLGSMIVFFISGLSSTALLMKHVPKELHYHRYRGKYADVLPHLQRAFGEMLVYLEPNIPSSVRDRLLSAVKELCDPDPANRGHPRNRMPGRNQFSLERYVASLDVAAKRAEVQLILERL